MNDYKDWETSDYYELLEISKNASQEVIEMAYKALCKKYHPDINKSKNATEIMQRINEAYSVLSDERLRKEYDDFLCYYISNDDEAEDYDYDEDEIIAPNLKKENLDKLNKQIYGIIDDTATTNSFIQGASGLIGSGVNLAVDAYAIARFYIPMVGKIRKVFGVGSSADETGEAIKAMVVDIVKDLIIDKGLGSIPIIGAIFNYRYANKMTWKIGLLFSYMSIVDRKLDKAEIQNTNALLDLIHGSNIGELDFDQATEILKIVEEGILDGMGYNDTIITCYNALQEVIAGE